MCEFQRHFNALQNAVLLPNRPDWPKNAAGEETSGEYLVTDTKSGSATTAFATVTVLFFLWGFATASIDPLVPSMKAVFHLTYAESMLTQFAFFLAYGVVSLPAAAVLERMGYANTTLIALGTMLLGCLLVPVATHTGTYAFVLTALFVIAAGIALLQVTANPLAALLGSPQRSDF